jgi:hypothetical protein
MIKDKNYAACTVSPRHNAITSETVSVITEWRRICGNTVQNHHQWQYSLPPWQLIRFLNPVDSQQDSLDWGSARYKITAYTKDNTSRINTHRHPCLCSGIRAHNLSVWAKKDNSCFWPLDHYDRHVDITHNKCRNIQCDYIRASYSLSFFILSSILTKKSSHYLNISKKLRTAHSHVLSVLSEHYYDRVSFNEGLLNVYFNKTSFHRQLQGLPNVGSHNWWGLYHGYEQI